MNLDFSDPSAAFGAFALNHYNKFDNIRLSSVISKVNKYCQDEYKESSVWVEVKKIYALNNTQVSYEELQSRVLTDFTNFSKHYGKPLFINFEKIFIVHAHARIVYERNLWNKVNGEIIKSKDAVGNFEEICKNIPIIYPCVSIYNSISSGGVNDLILKIDTWINNNKKNLNLITVLDVNFNRLTALPIEISHFTGLQKIYLAGQNIKTLPKEFCSLKKLKYIALDRNEIEEFPRVLCDLTNLESINLSSNKIKSLPDDIKKIVKLKNLTLKNNLIKSINESLCSLKLSTLNLDKNPINRTDLPKNMLAKKVIIAETQAVQEKQQLAILDQEKKLERKREFSLKQEQIWKAAEEKRIQESIMRSQQQHFIQNFLQNTPNRQQLAIALENESLESEFSYETDEDSNESLALINSNKRDNPFDDEDTDLKRARRK